LGSFASAPAGSTEIWGVRTPVVLNTGWQRGGGSAASDIDAPVVSSLLMLSARAQTKELINP